MKSKIAPPPFVAAVFEGAFKSIRREQLNAKREKDRCERDKKKKIKACKEAWQPVITLVEEFRRIFYESSTRADCGLRITDVDESWTPKIRQGYDTKFTLRRKQEAQGDEPALYIIDPAGSMPSDCKYFGAVNSKNLGKGTNDTKDFIPGLQLFFTDLLKRMDNLTFTKDGIFRGKRKLI